MIARFLTALALSLPGFALGAEGEAAWKPHGEKVGWWIFDLPRALLVIGMKNEGLFFHSHIICPLGSAVKVAEAIWYAGDEVSRAAIDCDGDHTQEDVRFHLEPHFFMTLPVLPRKQLFEAIYPHPNRP